VEKAPADIKELWPGAVQIVACRIRHLPRHSRYEVPADEVHYYLLTGPPGARALSAKRVAGLVRGHWGIENRLHHVKDRTFREDDQQVRCGAVALCWLRTVTLTLMEGAERRRRGKPRRYMPEQRAYYAAHPRKALALMNAR
jgi:hypothetical protein